MRLRFNKIKYRLISRAYTQKWKYGDSKRMDLAAKKLKVILIGIDG
jgi:hypothetical protein